MKLVCPCCGATLSIEAMLTDAKAREAVATALKLPHGLGDRVLRYLALFRPESRALSWGRAAKLLDELLPPIQEAQVQRNGRTWVAPLELWKAAFDQVLENRENLTLPLKGHGYLFEVVAGMASKAEGQQERKQEQQRQVLHPSHRPIQEGGGQSGPRAVADVVGGAQAQRREKQERSPMPDYVRRELDRLRGIHRRDEGESDDGEGRPAGGGASE